MLLLTLESTKLSKSLALYSNLVLKIYGLCLSLELSVPRNLPPFCPFHKLKKIKNFIQNTREPELKACFLLTKGYVSQSCVSSCTSSTSKTAWNCSFGLLLCDALVASVPPFGLLEHGTLPMAEIELITLWPRRVKMSITLT